jgi:hypothetical protein
MFLKKINNNDDDDDGFLSRRDLSNLEHIKNLLKMEDLPMKD